MPGYSPVSRVLYRLVYFVQILLIGFCLVCRLNADIYYGPNICCGCEHRRGHADECMEQGCLWGDVLRESLCADIFIL